MTWQCLTFGVLLVKFDTGRVEKLSQFIGECLLTMMRVLVGNISTGSI